MTEREKLLDLIISAKRNDPETGSFTERLTDYLLANGVTIQKWIPVSERLPEQGQEVIVASYRMIKPVVFTTIFWNKEHDNWYGITHWMPLPEPPKEVDK